MIWLSVNRDFFISVDPFRWKKFYFLVLRIFGGITVPVTTRRRTAIDDGDGGVRFPQQHVDETHRHGAGSLDQVIDFIVHDAGS
jgi:hypothetical protein